MDLGSKSSSKIKDVDDLSNINESDYSDYARLMACITAHYLDAKSRYDPMSIFLSSKINLIPYQIYDFNRLITEERTNGNIRALIAYETGLGKTILVGMILRELRSRSKQDSFASSAVNRVLIITPPAVLPQFRDEMKRKFGLEFKEFDGLVSSLTENMMIASMDTLKMKEWKERLAEYSWDIIIVDEYHRVSPFNQRGELISMLTSKTKHFIALTATPHDGRSDRYAFRIKTIAPSPLIIRRTKREALDVNNRKIFEQIPQEIKEEFPVTQEESSFYKSAERYAKERYKGSAAGALIAIVIGRAVSSSIRAGVKLLRRRRDKLLLPEELKDIAPEEYEDLYDKVREGGDLSEDDVERILSARPDSREELERELMILDPLIDEGKTLIASNPIDSKGIHLLELMREATEKGSKVLVFTGFIETVNYLKELLEKNGYNPLEITGAIDMDERNRIVKKFTEKETNRAIIGTDAMGESLNLQAASVEINYEVPWSPVSYIQRVGRIWRIGQKHKELIISNFLPAFEVERRVMKVILEKIKAINDEFGEVGLSVFGKELGTVDTLVKQAYAGEDVGDKIEDAFTKTQEAGRDVMDVLKKSMTLPSVVNVEELQRANIINIDDTFSEDDIRRFLQYLKDCGMGSGVFPSEINEKEQSTFHVIKDGEYKRISTLSLEDEGITAAIEEGMKLSKKEDATIAFNYTKQMDGRIVIYDVLMNGSPIYEEPILITSDGVLTYRGLLNLAPSFIESISTAHFVKLEDYQSKTEKRLLDIQNYLWEDVRKMKQDALLREKDAYKREWLREDLRKWLTQKPSGITFVEKEEIAHIKFIDKPPEQEWLDRYEVENEAMKEAMDHYAKEKYSVEDISTQDRGYDLECKRMDGILRVEVKGIQGASSPEMTCNEYKMAKFYGENFILFILEIDELKKRKYIIPDPINEITITEIMKPVYQATGFRAYEVP